MTSISTSRAATLAARHFGVTGEAAELPGEVDTNFRIQSGDESYVLKISPEETSQSMLSARQFAMTRLGSAGLPYRFPGSPPGGDDIITLPEGGSATMATWIDGVPFADAGRPIELAQDIGLLAGSVVRTLEGFAHPALHRHSDWDLAVAPTVLRELGPQVRNPADRELIDDILDRLIVQMPKLQQLPKQVIHGDINDLNVLVADDEVAGLIDFGDLIYSWRIAEVAIACAYAMLGQDDPIAVAMDVVTGYSEIAHVTEVEAELVYDLIRARLAVSVSVAASRAALGNPHHMVSEANVWELLERLDYVDSVAVSAELAHAAGRNAPDLSSTIRDRREGILGGALSLAYDSSPTGPLHIVRGDGVHLYDTRARRYLDCVNNVAHVGHAQPDVIDAAIAQMSLLNTNTRYLHDNVLNYAERLLAKLPDNLEVVHFVNSGSEANELAVRMARAATGRRAMAVLDHGYHGNTTTMIDLSPYKFNGAGGTGQPDWVTVFSLPDPLRSELDNAAYEAEVNRLLATGAPPAGFLGEAIVGCGGQIVPDGEDMRSIYAAIHDRGGVCIADEVQTGFGRVGSHFWAFELHDLTPDIVTMGKPIGNGHPLGAVATTRVVAEAFNNGMEYFNTFGGNPVSAAIGLAVLDVIEEEELQDNAAKVGTYLLERLSRLKSEHDAIGDVRGTGLFLGIELVKSRETKAPDPAMTLALVNFAKEHGVLLSIDGPHHNVIKIKPPIVFSQEDADQLVAVIASGLASD
ncbi:MAG: aminotransferase class III-fold pyridoxal phosphate-dependent enzyme [bacterium]|nr:aminotransferase class III-fold pyridoxal phosphate-dependent enzyme [bacterium]